MKTVVVTGSAGLVGSVCVREFASNGYLPVGIDNDLRKYFFGNEAATSWNRELLEQEISGYRHFSVDIRDRRAVDQIFAEYSSDISAVVHTAAQPSHDWAAKEPFTDFSVNADGTLNLLEATRKCCPAAVFIFTSTNKVYGDRPNLLPLVELETRWELAAEHTYYTHGIDESMSIDQSKHSLFGASKVAADILVQEYGRYFGMQTGCFRGGCLTGPCHSGAKLHGFLAYLMKCAVAREPYSVYGYKGKQVRDNIHAADLARMFLAFCRTPRSGEVYNVGGGRHSNCSVLEAIDLCERISGNKMKFEILPDNRIGDHIWYVSDIRKFRSHYPGWSYRYSLEELALEIYEGVRSRL